MVVKNLCRWIVRSSVVGCAGLWAATGLARADDSTAAGQDVSLESYYQALIEPCLADGLISASERQKILAVASRSLSGSQMAELERRIEEASETVTLPGAISVPVSNVSTMNAVEESVELAEGIVAVQPVESQVPQAVPHVALEESVGPCEPCESCAPGLCDNLVLFASWEGFKGPVDLGDRNGNFGVRLGFNWGYPLMDEHRIGMQLGSAVTIADFRGTQFTGDDERIQSFTTIGVFQRNACGVNWGLGYDFLADDYYHEMHLQQWRAQIGFDLTCCDEVGIWVARGTRGDSGFVFSPDPLGGPPIRGIEHRDPMTQGNVFWRHEWSNDAVTRVWLGLAEEHGEWTVGCDSAVPLCSGLALIGEAHYIAPSGSGFPSGASEEVWSLSLGIAFYPGQRPTRGTQNVYAPLLPVANNGTMAIDKSPE